MNKSDFLDELRLEVGLVPDYASTLHEFYTGVVQVLGKKVQEIEYSVSIYETQSTSFTLAVSSGKHFHPIVEPFGGGKLSICAIRGDVYTYPNNDYVYVMAPFYKGHHLLGLLVVQLQNNYYTISEEDIIFIKEVCRFIEVQQTRYNRSIF